VEREGHGKGRKGGGGTKGTVVFVLVFRGGFGGGLGLGREKREELCKGNVISARLRTRGEKKIRRRGECRA